MTGLRSQKGIFNSWGEGLQIFSKSTSPTSGYVRSQNPCPSISALEPMSPRRLPVEAQLGRFTGWTHTVISQKVFNVLKVRLFSLWAIALEPKGGTDLSQIVEAIGYEYRKPESFMGWSLSFLGSLNIASYITANYRIIPLESELFSADLIISIPLSRIYTIAGR